MAWAKETTHFLPLVRKKQDPVATAPGVAIVTQGHLEKYAFAED
jgi:hypothetical protein